MEGVSSRNAESLFETRTVVEIREVEAQTRKEIEEKKEELRQLVGASYRDLIESADSILLMRKSCEAVADNIQRMEEGFESLKTSITLSTVPSESDKERKRRESLFGLGSRVKYLVDTPEKIWGCLDEHMYLEGSERYLRAREVHSLLTETAAESNELFATFPLLRHQWPLVETFRGQISQRSRDRLQEPGLKVGDYAIALAAVGIIDELSSSQIFSLFLETRRMWLRMHLRTANAERDRGLRDKAANKIDKRNKRRAENGIADLVYNEEKVRVLSGSDSEGIAATLCLLVHMIQTSLCHVGELFLEVSGKMPLLFSTVLTSPPGSQLFGGIPNPEREVRLWKAHREKLETTMVFLSAKFITDSCISWLRKRAREIAVEGKLLLQDANSGKELAEVERVVRADLGKQVALGESLEWLKSAFGSAFDSPWDCLCELLLKEPTNLWEVLFEDMFVNRMKEIVDSGFQDIRIDDDLSDILSSQGSFEVVGDQKDSKRSTDAGTYLGGENLGFLSGLEVGGSLWKSTVVGKDSFSSFFDPEVTSLKDKIDEGLRKLLEDSLSFFQGPQSSARIEELAPYLQEQCRLCMMTVVKVLKDRLLDLSERMNKANKSSTQTGSKIQDSGDRLIQSVDSKGILLPESDSGDSFRALVIVERALFLGRLSAALSQNSSYVPIILGSPSNWNSHVNRALLKGSVLIGSRMSSMGGDHFLPDTPDMYFPKRGKPENFSSDSSPKLRELQRILRHQSIAAYSMWVAWSAEELTRSFARDLQNDHYLSTSSPLKGWEDTVLRQEEESGKEVEMKLALPAMPSPYVVSFLFAGCEEIYRVGGHVLDRAVLRFFAWKLHEKVLSAYETFLSDPSVLSSRVSEKGLLQLLFDLRFLTDVLSGGRDVSLETFDSEVDAVLGNGSRSRLPPTQYDTSTQASRKWMTTLLPKVLGKLDPIDWATYEPHLWENECRYYQRCAVLFGSLIQLNRLYTDTVLRLPSYADTNTLNVAGAIPRFTYLPISAPILSVNRRSGSRIPRSLPQEDSVPSLWAGYSNGEEGYKYGLSDTRAQSSMSGAKPLIKSLMGQVGSRFGEGLKLGLLSDGQVERFKGKSAAAISTFGDMLPVQAAGLFSSLTAGASKEA